MAYTTRRELLKKVHEGDNDAWQEFADFYRPLMLFFARKSHLTEQEKEELVQTVLVRIFKYDAARRYDPEKARFRAYISTIICRSIINIIKERDTKMIAVGGDSELDNLENAIQKGPSEIEAFYKAEWEEFILEKAEEIVSRKSAPETFMVYQLRKREVPPEQIAEMMQMSRNQVDKAYSRIKERLAKAVRHLNSLDGEPGE